MDTQELPARVREAVALLRKAESMFGGSLDYYMEKLAYHSEALLTIYAPLKVGDNAAIVGEIDCNNGWKGSEKHLEKGVIGEVIDVDYCKGRFVVDFVPATQWWKDSDGNYQQKTRLHSYHLPADKLGKVTMAAVSSAKESEGEG